MYVGEGGELQTEENKRTELHEHQSSSGTLLHLFLSRALSDGGNSNRNMSFKNEPYHVRGTDRLTRLKQSGNSLPPLVF